MTKNEFFSKILDGFNPIKEFSSVSREHYAESAWDEFCDNGGYIEIPAKDTVLNQPVVIGG